MLNFTNINISAVIGAACTIVLLPVGFILIKWIQVIPTVVITMPIPGIDDGVEAPVLPVTLTSNCLVILVWQVVTGVVASTYHLSQDTTLLLGNILTQIERFNELFSAYDALSQTMSSDLMLDDILGGERMVDSEIREEIALLEVKRSMVYIRTLEALYKVYAPSYVSSLETYFFED